eukprot:143192_1
MPSKTERNILAVLDQAGYCSNHKLSHTLQGSIWSCIHRKTREPVIIKVTSRKLHRESMMIHDGKKYNVEENIIKEKEILKYLTVQKRSASHSQTPIVAYRDFFKSNSNYYFAMQNGGHMLFDFCVRVHRYIESNKVEIAEWHRFVKLIFGQILDAIDYIHSRNVCHFDISLENLLINDVEVVLDQTTGKIKFCHDNVAVKLCDFGLSERFIGKNDFESTKYCGKPNYKSPECTRREPFDAAKNDVWCSGVCLFMSLIGGNMCSKASPNDDSFAQIMNGEMDQLLKKWNRIHYLDNDRELIDLFKKIFVCEDRRATIHQIKQHKW